MYRALNRRMSVYIENAIGLVFHKLSGKWPYSSENIRRLHPCRPFNNLHYNYLLVLVIIHPLLCIIFMQRHTFHERPRLGGSTKHLMTWSKFSELNLLPLKIFLVFSFRHRELKIIFFLHIGACLSWQPIYMLGSKKYTYVIQIPYC